jgi:hypothetical protein
MRGGKRMVQEMIRQMKGEKRGRVQYSAGNN